MKSLEYIEVEMIKAKALPATTFEQAVTEVIELCKTYKCDNVHFEFNDTLIYVFLSSTISSLEKAYNQISNFQKEILEKYKEYGW